MAHGWAPRTRAGYGSAIKRYLSFTTAHGLDPLQLTEQLVLRYVAFLHTQKLAPATIKNYLSAIRAWIISMGLPEPNIWTPRVHLAWRALSRDHPPPHQSSPINYHILSLMFSSLSPSRDHLLIASALALQYYACLRASELCANPTLGMVPLRSHISFIFSNSSPVLVYQCISSKTAVHGFQVHVGCSGNPICAVCILHHYLSSHPIPPSHPLFQFSSGHLLTYPVYNAIIKRLIRLAGLNPASYSTHSIRAGAATQAASAGLSPDDIKRLGRWRSQAYMVYLRPPPEAYALLAPALAPSSSS